jgi:hypothetical protein
MAKKSVKTVVTSKTKSLSINLQKAVGHNQNLLESACFWCVEYRDPTAFSRFKQ